MLINPVNFLSDWNRNVDNKYIVIAKIGDDNCVLMVEENIEEIRNVHPDLKYMVTNLSTAKVLVYGKSVAELGLSLVNKYKGQPMEMYSVYKDFDEYDDADKC
uniref:hypothetical protein n=1 Tax=Lactobacillus acidophilus TaxID=1579 RepID=UPI003F56345D